VILDRIYSLFSQTTPDNCQNAPAAGSETGCLSVLPEVAADENSVKIILSLAFGVIAAICILYLILAAINLAVGGDDPEKIGRAKRGVIFALLGLAIALSAEVIVLTFLGNL